MTANDAPFFVPLSHNALIAVTGDDAAAFLHAQLTNDVLGLAPGASQWNGWCSPKGRLLATMLVVRSEASRYLIMLPAEIAEPVRKRLSMFVLRSRVKLEDVTNGHALLGVAGERAREAIEQAFGEAPATMQSVTAQGAHVVALEARRFLVLAASASAESARAMLAKAAEPGSAAAWELASIRAGVPTIVAATQEAFVPQMANFEIVGGVSFHKGCYPGQEIVARTQYRGTLKRRMAIAHVDSAAKAGDSVYSAGFGDQAAGTIVNAAPTPEGGYDALVVAQLEGLERDDLRLAGLEGPAIRIISRPYAAAPAEA